MEVWRGEKPKAKDTGEVDRSASLMKIGRTLYDASATGRTVAEALKEQDLALGVTEFVKPPSPHGQPVDSGELLPVLGRPATDSGAGPKRMQARD